MGEEAGWRASGRVGVPPAIFRVPLNTLEGSWCTERLGSSAGCRAGRAPRQAGRPPYPRHAIPLSVRLFVQEGMTGKKPRSGGIWREAPDVVTPLRGFSILPSYPWVPRRLVIHGYCCLGATRQAHPSVHTLVRQPWECAAWASAYAYAMTATPPRLRPARARAHSARERRGVRLPASAPARLDRGAAPDRE